MVEKKYTIGEKVYVQKPLVLAQLRQLTDILKDVVLPSDLTVGSLVISLGSNIAPAMAVVLTEEGTDIRKKNIEEVTSDLEFNMSPNQTLEVVEDFFVITDISSLIDRFNEMMEKVIENLNQKKE